MRSSLRINSEAALTLMGGVGPSFSMNWRNKTVKELKLEKISQNSKVDSLLPLAVGWMSSPMIGPFSRRTSN